MATKYKTIATYIAPLSADKRAMLQKLRKIIQAAAPQAEECISYGVPSFRRDGKFLLSFGAATKHCALYPGGYAVDKYKDELVKYQTSTGTVRFPWDKPLPVALVRKLVKARVQRQTQRD